MSEPTSISDEAEAEKAWRDWYVTDWDDCEDQGDDQHREMMRTTLAAFLAGFRAALDRATKENNHE